MIRSSATVFALLLFAAFAAGCGPAAQARQIPDLVFGRTGIGPGEFNYPRAVALGPDGLIYIVDKAGRIQAFDQSGRFQRDWRMPAIDAGKPTGLGIGPDGTVYAADTHYSRVTWFSPTGEIRGSFGSFGEAPGQFRLPTDVAVNAAGEIYVSEYGGNDRISKFTRDWQFITSFGGRDAGPAQMERPQCVRIAPDQSIWTCDSCHHRVCHFSAGGELLGSFGKEGNGPGEFSFPYNVDLLSDGSLVVCEYGNNRVQHFDAGGKFLGQWGAAGREAGQLAYPWALVTADNDRVFIVDSGNNRVQVIRAGQAATWRAAATQ